MKTILNYFISIAKLYCPTDWLGLAWNDFSCGYAWLVIALAFAFALAFGWEVLVCQLRLAGLWPPPHGYINFLRFFCFIATPLKLN